MAFFKIMLEACKYAIEDGMREVLACDQQVLNFNMYLRGCILSVNKVENIPGLNMDFSKFVTGRIYSRMPLCGHKLGERRIRGRAVEHRFLVRMISAYTFDSYS